MTGMSAGPLQSVAIVLRQSPDWEALSQRYLEGELVAVAEYAPPFRVPGFPPNLGELVQIWNDLFGLDYFCCRARLKRIAQDTLSLVPATLIPYQELAQAADALAASTFFFFVDDDDWFAPYLADVCALLDPATSCVCFPLPLVTADYLTLVDASEGPTDRYLGPSRRFDLPFHTNNYGVRGTLLLTSPAAFRDHVIASDFALKSQLSVSYFPHVVSAAVKTPASAGALGGLLNADGYMSEMVRFVDGLRSIEIPAHLEWIERPTRAVEQLFRDTLASRRSVNPRWVVPKDF